ncbi:MAG: hypothetical protein IPG21_17270 [Saprospiraceae bacterium]|nr:hypothetical protein [Candidatus Vicinibacter affinis]
MNKLANSNYYEYLTKEISDLTQNPKIIFLDLIQFIKAQPTFLNDDFINKLFVLLRASIIENCSLKIITDCWRENFIEHLRDFDTEQIINHSKADLIYFLHCEKCNENIATHILDKFLIDQDFNTLLEESNKINFELFNKYDKLVFESATKQQYFELWKRKRAKITPFGFISDYLNHQEERFIELNEWINLELLTKEDAIILLTSNLKNIEPINDRFKFYKILIP